MTLEIINIINNNKNNIKNVLKREDENITIILNRLKAENKLSIVNPYKIKIDREEYSDWFFENLCRAYFEATGMSTRTSAINIMHEFLSSIKSSENKKLDILTINDILKTITENYYEKKAKNTEKPPVRRLLSIIDKISKDLGDLSKSIDNGGTQIEENSINILPISAESSSIIFDITLLITLYYIENRAKACKGILFLIDEAHYIFKHQSTYDRNHIKENFVEKMRIGRRKNLYFILATHILDYIPEEVRNLANNWFILKTIGGSTKQKILSSFPDLRIDLEKLSLGKVVILNSGFPSGLVATF